MVNRKFEEINGIKAEEVRGKTPDQFFPAKFASALLAMDQVVINEGCFVERELDLVDRDGSPKTRLVTKFPVRGPNGDVIAIGGIITDRTERKKVEEELRQAQKMEVVGQLTGGVAHDFNNLLMIITGNLELALENLTDDPEIADLVRRANEAADRGATLTHRLLAFSRKQTLMPGIVDLDELVASLTNLLRRTMPEIVEIKTASTEKPVALQGGPEPDRKRNSQPRDQRPRCDAGRRQAHDRNRERHGRRTLRNVDGRYDTGRLRHGRGDRHRYRHDVSRNRSCVRTLLHDEGSRKRFGSRPFDDLRLRQTIRRTRHYL